MHRTERLTNRLWHPRTWSIVLVSLIVLSLAGLYAFRHQADIAGWLQEKRAEAGTQLVSVGQAPTSPWDHGAGQSCAACHGMEQGKPPELDLRAIPQGSPLEMDRAAEPAGEESEGEDEGEGPRQRLGFFVAQRAYPKDALPPGARMKALEVVWQHSAKYMADRPGPTASLPQWVNIGPAPMKNSAMGNVLIDVSGRVKALLVHPQNGNIVYAGTAQGGVWKTTDGGSHWVPLTDDQASLAIGALAMDPTGPNTIYAGTGEPHPGLDNYYGAGILKTTDGGATWTRLGAAEFTGLGIASIVIDPSNTRTLYVASARTGVAGATTPTRGIYKSTDGGATWQALLTCTNCWGASDLVMDAANSATLYAAFGGHGIYKTTNGGANWTQLTNGLPQSNYRRIELGISASNPSVLYAGYHYREQGQYDGALVFRTQDGGANWIWLQQTPNYCTGQCWYDNIIGVDPTDPNTVYLGGSANYIWQPTTRIKEVVIKSTDGGITWWDMTPNNDPAHTLHPDMHAIAFDPSEHNTIWVGNDGGVFRSTDGGQTWLARNNGLSTLQFTGIAIHPSKPSVVYGGMQDNNKAKTDGSSVVWDALDAGGYAAIDPFNPSYYYGTRYGIQFQRNDRGGSAPISDWPVKISGINHNDRALFYAPFALDPSSQGVLYYGTHRLYRTANRGDLWAPISGDLTKGEGSISAIAVAPSAAGTIYVGTSDGNVWGTANTGGSWSSVTKVPLPNRFVSGIAVLHNDDQTVYVVYNGFDSHTPNRPGHVFKSTDMGRSWQNISANLPDIPALCIVLDRDAPGILYIGSDVGVFRSTNDGTSWEPFSNGLANVAVVDLAIDPTHDVLVAATHGRSVYRIDLPAAPQATATPTKTSMPTETTRPTATGTRLPSIVSLRLPLIMRNHIWSARTATPTRATRTPSPTSTPISTLPTTATPGGTLLPTQTPTLTPTTGATSTPTETPGGPTPAPTQAPSARVYYDDFSNPTSGWVRGVSGSCYADYAEGEYYVEAGSHTGVCLYAAPTDPRVNGTYEVKARRSSIWDGSTYGLVFGLDDRSSFSQFYVFWVDPGYQNYMLETYDGDWGAVLVEWTFSEAIAADADTNVLRVRRQGDQIKLYVNGTHLTTVTDNSFSGNGYVGVANWAEDGGGASWTALFDDVMIAVNTVVLYDDFHNPYSGWPVGSIESCQAGYQEGEYWTGTEPDYACVYRSPGGHRPNGHFEVKIRREESIYPTAYGLLFGESGDFTSFYTFWVIPDTQEYALTLYSDGWWALTWDDEDDDAWIYSAEIGATTAVNTLAVERDGSQMSLYVNGTYLETLEDDSLLANGFFGVANWASNYAPVTAYFDDYQVIVWEEPPMLTGSTWRPAAQRSIEMTDIKPR